MRELLLHFARVRVLRQPCIVLRFSELHDTRVMPTHRSAGRFVATPAYHIALLTTLAVRCSSKNINDNNSQTRTYTHTRTQHLFSSTDRANDLKQANKQLSRKFFTSLLQPSSCLHILLPTPRDPIYNYNSIKIFKQISTPPQPYQKIPDIYFLRSCSLPNFIAIPSPITIQFVYGRPME